MVKELQVSLIIKSEPGRDGIFGMQNIHSNIAVLGTSNNNIKYNICLPNMPSD
jgi:hypothetical protein